MLKLVDENVLELVEAVALLTSKPAQILGIEAGQLSVGATADVCVFDPKLAWILTEDQIVSRGRNTPFPRLEIPRPCHALAVGGKLVFER